MTKTDTKIQYRSYSMITHKRLKTPVILPHENPQLK